MVFVQFLYDVVPLVLISHQHHTAFKNEERDQTTMTTGTTITRDYTQLRPPSDQTMVSLEKRKLSHEALSDPGSPIFYQDTSMGNRELSMAEQIKTVIEHYRSETDGQTASNSDPANAKNRSDGSNKQRDGQTPNISLMADSDGPEDKQEHLDVVHLHPHMINFTKPPSSGRESIAVETTRRSVSELLQL